MASAFARCDPWMIVLMTDRPHTLIFVLCMEGLRSFWSPGCFGQNAPRAPADRAERVGAQPRSSRQTGRRGWSGVVIGALIHPPSGHCAAAPRASLWSCCARRAETCGQRRAEGASSLTVRVHTTRAAGAERASDIAAPTRTRGRTTEARMDAAGCIIRQWPARLLAPLLPRAAEAVGDRADEDGGGSCVSCGI